MNFNSCILSYTSKAKASSWHLIFFPIHQISRIQSFNGYGLAMIADLAALLILWLRITRQKWNFLTISNSTLLL